jgi:hypothetical protein
VFDGGPVGQQPDGGLGRQRGRVERAGRLAHQRPQLGRSEAPLVTGFVLAAAIGRVHVFDHTHPL